MDIIIPSESRFEVLKQGRVVKFMTGKINDCCQQKENLYLADKDDKQKLTTWRCRVCGRAHRVMRAEPGHFGIVDLGMRGRPIGK